VDRKNKIIFTMNRTLTEVEKIEVSTDDRYHVDATIGFLSKCFRSAAWGALRFLVQVNGQKLYTDPREGEIMKNISKLKIDGLKI
jgi:hypothetical protein